MNKRFDRTATALALLLAAGMAATAQERTLTLEETLRLADEQSLDVRKARTALERAQRAVDNARALFLPEVGASGEYFYNLQPQVFFIAPGTILNESSTVQVVPIGSRHVAGIGVNVTQPLYDPLRRMQRVVAEAGVQVTRAQLDAARALVRMNAEKAFYRALFAQQETALADSQIAVTMKNAAIVMARFKVGRAMALDTLTSGVSIARSRADAERARYGEQGALLVLAQLLDLPNYQNLHVDGRLEIPGAPGPSGGEVLAPPAEMNSAQARLAESRRDAARVDVQAQRSTAEPTINAVGRWQTLGQSNAAFPDDFRWAMTSAIGVTAQVPISNLWRDDPKQQDAELRVREAELEIQAIRKNDSLQLETLMLAMHGARAQLSAQESAIDQASAAVDITTVLYKEGRATLLDVENAQARRRDLQLAAQRLKLQFLDAYAEVKAIAGDAEIGDRK